MSTAIFIDTLFVVALINRRDQYHRCAVDLSAFHDGGRFLTTDAVLLEIGNALGRKYRKQAVRVIQDLLDSDDVDVVRLTPDLFEQAFRLYKTHEDKEWGLIDCFSFVAMRQAEIREALTFDAHFVQAGFRALMRASE